MWCPLHLSFHLPHRTLVFEPVLLHRIYGPVTATMRRFLALLCPLADAGNPARFWSFQFNASCQAFPCFIPRAHVLALSPLIGANRLNLIESARLAAPRQRAKPPLFTLPVDRMGFSVIPHARG
jgi:hypothetical protein